MKEYRPRWFTPKRAATYLLIFLFFSSYYCWHCAREYGENWQCSNLLSNEGWGAYGDLTRAFVNGQVALLNQPDPKLALSKDPYDPAQRLPETENANDYSYYHGKYYLYFGPVPALLVCCPWYYATGHFPSEKLVVFILCILNVIFFFCLVRSLIANYFTRTPLWLEGTIYVMYGSTNLLAYIAGRVDKYEMAIASSAAFTLGFFLFLLLAINHNSRRWPWLILASLCAGLAAGSKPTTVFLFVILGFYWIYLHHKPKWSGTLGVDTLAVFVPAFLSVGALLWYNEARFDNPFCFGLQYVLNSGDVHSHPNFELKNIPDGIWTYYFSPWLIDSDFPYVSILTNAYPSWICLPHPIREPCAGLFPSFPIDVLTFLWPFCILKLSGSDKNPLMLFGVFASGWALFLGILSSTFFATAERYEIELQLPLLLLITLTLLSRRHLGPLPLWHRLVFFSLLTASCYIGIAYGLTSENFWIQDVLSRAHMKTPP